MCWEKAWALCTQDPPRTGPVYIHDNQTSCKHIAPLSSKKCSSQLSKPREVVMRTLQCVAKSVSSVGGLRTPGTCDWHLK